MACKTADIVCVVPDVIRTHERVADEENGKIEPNEVIVSCDLVSIGIARR